MDLNVMEGIAPLAMESQSASQRPVIMAKGDRETDTPWSDFNASANMPALLEKYGWRRAGGPDDNQQWTRPGKNGGTSGTLRKDGVFYCFTSSAAPLVARTGYDAWGVYVQYEHAGDFRQAARKYRREFMRNGQLRDPAGATFEGLPVEEPEAFETLQESEPTGEIAPVNFPDFENASVLLEYPPERPDELIEGVCFDLSKIFMSGPSKARKTFFQIYLALCIATGSDWFGRKVKQGRVLYINLELRRYSFYARMRDILAKLGKTDVSLMDCWHLRGKSVTVEQLRTALQQKLASNEYALIIVDPLYKLLGDRSENDASEMADLFGVLETIAHNAGASIFVAHHHAKGHSAAKNAIDRGSGSGVLGRDGDTIIDLSQHEVEDCMVMEIIVRDLPPNPKMVLRWTHPMFEPDGSLNPDSLKRPGAQQVDVTTDDIMAATTKTFQTREQIEQAVKLKTRRGNNAVQKAFRAAMDAKLFKVEETKRPRTNPLFRYAIRDLPDKTEPAPAKSVESPTETKETHTAPAVIGAGGCVSDPAISKTPNQTDLLGDKPRRKRTKHRRDPRNKS